MVADCDINTPEALNRQALLITRSIVELRRSRRFVRGDLLRLFNRPAVLQVSCDAGRSECVAVSRARARGRQTGVARPRHAPLGGAARNTLSPIAQEGQMSNPPQTSPPFPHTIVSSSRFPHRPVTPASLPQTIVIPPDNRVSPRRRCCPYNRAAPDHLISPDDVAPKNFIAPQNLVPPENFVSPEDLVAPENFIPPEDLIAPEDLVGADILPAETCGLLIRTFGCSPHQTIRGVPLRSLSSDGWARVSLRQRRPLH